MTYTVIGKCARTGKLGIGIATYSLAVGQFCNGLRRGVGATISQANVRHPNNQRALGLLGEGQAPQQILDQLLGDDPYAAYRQIAVMDAAGHAVAYSGDKARPWHGHTVGEGFVTFGNGLAGQHVMDAMTRGFLAHPEHDLAERLLASIEHGRDAGGQVAGERKMPERSAALLVFADADFPEFDLRVDLHPTAVQELRRLYTAYRPHEPYYRQRSADPTQATPLDVFEAALSPAEREALFN